MSDGMEAACLRLLDLARKQKDALDAGALDEVIALADMRQKLLLEIQKIDGSPGHKGQDGKPAFPVSLIRRILSTDEETAELARSRMRGISIKISEINTLKVCYQGAVDGARPRGGVPGR
ncbi:MAG: flagellar protein FliT [Thermodesulfobacteriota bacterium]